MKNINPAILLITISLFITNSIYSQYSDNTNASFTIIVNNICMIATNNAPVSLTLSTSVAGSSVSPVSNSDMYLKITSIVPSGSTRKITARITNGEVPTGTILKLNASPCINADIGGDLGTVIATPITLGSSEQIIINGIASCYTDNGYNDGYRLTFTWQPDATNYFLINAPSSPETITTTFTIASNV